MTDAHAHDPQRVVVPERTRRALIAVMAPLLLGIVAGMVLLWPGTLQTDALTDAIAADDFFRAKVVTVTEGACEGTEPDAGITCALPDVRLLEGPDEGDVITLTEEPEDGGVHFDVGDEIVLAYYPDAGPPFEYAFADRERRTPLLGLLAVFAIAVVALARWKGLRALGGVVVSFVVLAVFILPALLDGSDPVLVALVGAGAIAVAALYLAHGINVRSTIALIGAFASLAIVGLLAWAFVGLTELSGRAAEEAGFLQVAASQVDLRGLVLAGVVIGTLGVLDDVTVLQVSAVWELHHADPTMSRRSLVAAAIRIGRDHIASTVNTLVLAYAGASLPLFLLLTQAHEGLSDIANSEVVATEIVRTLVGSIGLVAAVPITTMLAAWVVSDRAVEVTQHGDPRRYASRAERQLWDAATAAPIAMPAAPEVEPEPDPQPPPLPPNRAL